MLSEISKSDTKTPGKVLRMIYLLPSLSMTKTATIEPTALTKARGMLRMIPSYSLSSMPSMVVPESMIISGP